MMKKRSEFPSAAPGFSLIEALVALVLISVGVLGMVALQGRAIQYTQDSVQRNNAAMLANDLVEMIRANPAGLSDASGFFKAGGADFPEEPDTCTPLPDDAEGQLACWGQRVADALPGAGDLLNSEYFICRANAAGACNAAGDNIAIQLAWNVKSGECLDANAGENDDPTVCRYRLLTRIQ